MRKEKERKIEESKNTVTRLWYYIIIYLIVFNWSIIQSNNECHKMDIRVNKTPIIWF